MFSLWRLALSPLRSFVKNRLFTSHVYMNWNSENGDSLRQVNKCTLTMARVFRLVIAKSSSRADALHGTRHEPRYPAQSPNLARVEHLTTLSGVGNELHRRWQPMICEKIAVVYVHSSTIFELVQVPHLDGSGLADFTIYWIEAFTRVQAWIILKNQDTLICLATEKDAGWKWRLAARYQ